MSIVEAEHPAGVPVSVAVEIGGKEITFETGKLAKQADGAVVVHSGETVVLGTAQGRTEAREGADFFPLTVDVEERMYAAGKIPGGFFKREGRPTERAILTARMTDRPVRPLWPKGYRNEVQCVATVFSADLVTPHDILSINAVSAALTISPLPFLGPIGAVRMGLIEGELVINPTLEEIDSSSDLDLIVVGTKDGLTMVEAGAKQVPEDKLLEALEIAQAEIIKLCGAQEELRAKAGKAKWLDGGVTERLEGAHGHAIWTRIQEQGLREAASIVEEIVTQEVGPATDSVTQGSVDKELQVRMSLAQILEKQRSAAVEGPVREQFEADLRALTDAEQDSKELKSAKRGLLVEHRARVGAAAFPGRRGRPERQGLAHEELRQEGGRRDLQEPRPAEDRRRQAAPRRPLRDGDPPDRGRGLGPAAHARLGSLHPRPDADHDAADPGNGEGGAADRRPLAREGSPVHAPLQLPALLGGRDRPHGVAEAARHRPRRPRPAGPAGGHPAGRGLPVHDPARLRDARVERLVVDGVRLRLDARADGCRCADHGTGLGHRDGARQGGRRLRHPHRHPGSRGSPR